MIATTTPEREQNIHSLCGDVKSFMLHVLPVGSKLRSLVYARRLSGGSFWQSL
jgi:hypothetical protein